MPTVAYLANLFPTPVEPYVMDEIRELRRRGVKVVPCSMRLARADLNSELTAWIAETQYLQPLRLVIVIRAAVLCITQFLVLKDFFRRALIRRTTNEHRVRALLHTLLGVYLAALLRDLEIEHIHVHHGYFGSWVAMVVARLLRAPFSMTLHGSDLLIHAAYLDMKLEQCQFCITISEFNRQFILENYPRTDPDKVILNRIGIDCSPPLPRESIPIDDEAVQILSVGRLHQVKNYTFLVRACGWLKRRGFHFTCSIAGDGPERLPLEDQILALQVQREVRLLGQLKHAEVDQLYDKADLVVLTSRSEGIPLALMEAMVRGKIVVAPKITGIPELVIDGVTGFLYEAGNLDEFVRRVELIGSLRGALEELRHAARRHVLEYFNRDKNLASLCELFLTRLRPGTALAEEIKAIPCYESPVLQ